jgi:hypothetical protein
VVAGALIAAAILVGTRLQVHPGPPIAAGAAALDPTRAAASPGGGNMALPPESRADRATSVEDLPRAPVPARIRSVRAPNALARATASAAADVPIEGAQAAALASSSAVAAPAGESPSAQAPEVELPSVPPPPPDPLIRAVQQSIDDGTGK